MHSWTGSSANTMEMFRAKLSLVEIFGKEAIQHNYNHVRIKI